MTMSDDDVPLYESAEVSKLGAMIVVMFFALRHKLSGQALFDLVEVLCALLPDSHKFVTSAYLLKKYFADLFGEPAQHSYCGNCHVGMQRRLKTFWSWICICVYVSCVVFWAFSCLPYLVCPCMDSLV